MFVFSTSLLKPLLLACLEHRRLPRGGLEMAIGCLTGLLTVEGISNCGNHVSYGFSLVVAWSATKSVTRYRRFYLCLQPKSLI
jgi:hypothetical protein